jgi:hypothetical protein
MEKYDYEEYQPEIIANILNVSLNREMEVKVVMSKQFKKSIQFY